MSVKDPEGNTLPPNTNGALVVELPLPPGCFGSLYQNKERFKSSYMDRFPGVASVQQIEAKQTDSNSDTDTDTDTDTEGGIGQKGPNRDSSSRGHTDTTERSNRRIDVCGTIL